jgi:acyl dehydratase
VTAFDAIVVGETAEFGSYEFTVERIKHFARDWDPQRFHVDEEEAAKSSFGALCASGWHTAAVMMRLQVDYFAARARSGAPTLRFGPSPGFDNLKWLRPVYAGDTITYAGTVKEKRLSRSRPGTGIVTTAFTGVNQNGEMVFSVLAHVFVAVE